MKNFSRIARLLLLTLVISAALAAPCLAQGTGDGHTFINAKDTKWGDAPPTLPKGAKLAVLAGDPGKPVPFTIRLMMPANYNIPPHWHTQDENLTVVSGALYLGMGDKTEKPKARALMAGGFHFLPGRRIITPSRRQLRSFRYTARGPSTSTISTPRTIPSKRINRAPGSF